MAGLGLAKPELMNAVRLATVNGAGALPQSIPGVGQAPAPVQPSAPPPAPSAVAPLPYPAEMGVAPPPGAVSPLPLPQIDPSQPGPASPQAPSNPPPDDGKTDPHWWEVVGAIGHVILSVDAGLRNQAMPEPPGGDPMQKQDQEMQVQEFTMNVVARAWEAYRKAPPGQRKKMLEQFQDIIDKVNPGFDLPGFLDGLKEDGDWVDEIAPDVSVMSEDAKSMFMAKVGEVGGDPAAAAATVLKDREFMNTLRLMDDTKNIPVLKFKLQKMRAALASMNMDPETFKGMTVDDLMRLNENLPKGVRLTPSELATMRRHPDLGTIIGMSSPDEDAAPQPGDGTTIDESAGRRPSPRAPSPRGPALDPNEESEDPDEADAPVRPAPRPRAGPVAPSTSPRPGRPQTPAPRPQAPAPRPGTPAPRTPTPAPRQPYYPPGWKPRTPAPAPAPTGRTPAPAPAQDSRKPPPRRPAPAPEGPKPPREKRVVAPKDMNIPGFGKVKKGEALIYDYETGQYRRG